jgi:tetratricopeptide (TPR) repeat protein
VATAFRLLSAGAWHEAEVAARAVLEQDPDDRHGALLLGLAIAAMGDDARAAPILTAVAGLAPQAHHPCLDLTRLTPALPSALVVRQFRACLRLAPRDDRLRLDFAEFLLDLGQEAEAEAVLAEGPDTAAGHHLRGLVRGELGDFAAAVDSFERAVALNPDAAASWSNLGMMRKVEGRFAPAIDAHDRAVALAPGNHRYRVNRAVALLKMGAWGCAWQDYESRLLLTNSSMVGHGCLMPSLRPGFGQPGVGRPDPGRPDDERPDDERPGVALAGLTVVALHEDGFGDTLQFLRYLPLLAERGARVVACVPPALERVMQLVPGVAGVTPDTDHLPAHDFVCPMFSLPRVFGTTIETIPAAPQLMLDPALVRRWAVWLPDGGLRVGLVWAGQARPSLPGFTALDRRRSAGLASFAPLFEVPDVVFVSLQAGPAAGQLKPAGVVLADPMPDVVDFADTAAIIAGLDVVISVDTSVVHLAGLMGKPVLLLDRYDGCWRWLSGRADSPWYPLLTIFRQSRSNDWSEPMAGAAATLRAMAVPRKAGTGEHAFVA